MSDTPATSSKPVFYWAARGHLLGETSNEEGPFYGIWDLKNPGPPIERFEKSDEGWQAATKRIVRLNNSNPCVQLQRGVTCPTCGVQAVRRITTADKAASAMLIGVFALGKISKTFQCMYCRYSW